MGFVFQKGNKRKEKGDYDDILFFAMFTKGGNWWRLILFLLFLLFYPP